LRTEHFHRGKVNFEKKLKSLFFGGEIVKVLQERKMRLSQAALQLGRNVATVWRWTTEGVIARDGKRVRLESVRLGGWTVTSEEALERFIEKLSAQEPVASC
jgi:hypothetical protein